MIMRPALSLGLVCELLVGGLLRAQVKPPPPGPAADEPDVARVVAIGTAAVFNGNTAAARHAALQAAYSEAVAMCAGTT